MFEDVVKEALENEKEDKIDRNLVRDEDTAHFNNFVNVLEHTRPETLLEILRVAAKRKCIINPLKDEPGTDAALYLSIAEYLYRVHTWTERIDADLADIDKRLREIEGDEK
jgi:hypothetical protein